MQKAEILKQNSESWNKIADDWLGVTALPDFGPYTPTEEELRLFGDVAGKHVLDIGCGSGHSLKYLADKGAAELWGLDLSARQIENASAFLKENGCTPHLFVSPMEENPGIPESYFDFVYSIYAIGWTVDLKRTMSLAAGYLKTGGHFIFSWDNPLLECVSAQDNTIILQRPFIGEDRIEMVKGGCPMSLTNWKLSSYINALAEAGFQVERLIEETDADSMQKEAEFSQKYYSHFKAKLLNQSLIIKAKKL